MFLKNYVAAGAVAISSFASAAGAQPASLKSTDSTAQVPQTTYDSAFSGYRAAVETNVSPAALWRQANAAVASSAMEGGGHTGHNSMPGAKDQQTPSEAASANPHAGHGAIANPAGQVSDERHKKPPVTMKPSPLAGQSGMPANAGEKVMPTPASNPHAGHTMPAEVKSAVPTGHEGHSMPSKPGVQAAPTSGHGSLHKQTEPGRVGPAKPVPSAGQQMPVMAEPMTSGSHGSHSAPAKTAAPRDGRRSPSKQESVTPTKLDPHAGHQMSPVPSTKPASSPVRPALATPTSAADEHGKHTGQLEKEGKK